MIYFETDAEGGSPRWLCDYQRVLVNAFTDIESTGFPFDPIVHQQFTSNTERIYAEYEKKLMNHPQLQAYIQKKGLPPEGKKAFNLASATQLQEFLFSPKSSGGLELVPVKRSKLTDKASSDRESLQHFAQEGNAFCIDLLVLRNFGKLLSSFGSPLLKFYCPRTGAVHPVYFLAKVTDSAGVAGGTATGRLSCKHPNMQQLPKRDKDDKGVGLAGIDVRRSFVPFPGHLLVEADQCVGVGTRVLTTDLDWISAENVKVGDELIGFDEVPSARKSRMKSVVVEKVKLLRQPCYKITTDRGVVVSSASHRWLGCRKKEGTTGRKREWLTTENLVVGNTISYYVQPWEYDSSREGGWLAGFLDGEGWIGLERKGEKKDLHVTGCGFGQKEGAILDYAINLLEARGLKLDRCKNKCGFGKDVIKIRSTGEALSAMRWLGMFKPRRLMEKRRYLWEGRSSWGKRSTPARILNIEFIGEQDVVGLQTSSGTFIAEGFMSHNSQIEVRVAGMYAKDTTMGKFFEEGGDFHIRVASRVFQQDFDHMVAVLSNDTHPEYKKFKQYRSAAKAFTFGLMFGMGLGKLTRQSGLTEAAGQAFIDEYFTVFPQFASWREEMIDWAKEYGWVRTLFGRKRTIKISGYETEDGREERIGINTPIQSAAADITLFGLARIWEWLIREQYEAKILGTVHDSIIFSIPYDEVNDVLPRIARMMIRPPGLEWLLDEVPVPLSVGVDIGPNLRDMSSLDLEDVLTGSINVREYL